MNKEDDNNNRNVPHISKIDEERAVDFIKKIYGKKYPGIGRNLRKIKQERSSDPDTSDQIDYQSDYKGAEIIFHIRWFDDLTVGSKWANSSFKSRVWVSVDDPDAYERIMTENKEPETQSFIITKEEEERALDVISKNLIGPAVESFNEAVRSVQLHHIYDEITEKEVRKDLKKVGRTSHDPKSLNKKKFDLIKYRSDVNIDKKFPITFHIYKNIYGLEVQWNHQYSQYGNKNRIIYIYRNKKLNEGVVGGEEEYKLTREEEQYSYYYLTHHIMTKAIEEAYFKFLKKHPGMYPERKYPRITIQDICKKLIKKSADIDRVEYESVINDYVGFNFIIKKEVLLTGKFYIVAGCQSPIDGNWKWYDVKNV